MKDIYIKLEHTMTKNRYTAYIHPPYELECKLVQAIQQMDHTKSIETLNKINSMERAQLSVEPFISLKYSIIASCTLFTRAVIETGLDSETAFMLSDYYINLIDKTSNNDDLKNVEYAMLDDFIKVLKKYKECSFNPLINRTISYIRKNVENNLSLQEISSFLHIHPNYLSAAFKKEVGKTLTEYISELKIAAIKMYISNTNLSINEISCTFNFNHRTYFCRYFKYHTGFSPTQYRKQCSSINSSLVDS